MPHTASGYTPAMFIFEMFEGFWSWPFSQKVFGTLWLLALVACVVVEVGVIYLATGHHL